MIVIPPQSSAWPWGDSGQSRCLGGWYHQFKSKSSGHLWFWYVLMASRHHIFRDPPIPNFRLGLQPVDLAGGRWENVSSQESFICVLNVANKVGGRNAAPVEEFIPLFIGFQPSKVVQDFFHPQYEACQEHVTYLWTRNADGQTESMSKQIWGPYLECSSSHTWI